MTKLNKDARILSQLKGEVFDMESMKSTYFEETLFNTMLESSGNMIESLTNLNRLLDKFVITDAPILSVIRSLKNNTLKEKMMDYYNRSISEIQNTAHFYASVSSFYNKSIFRNNHLTLKDLKVSEIVEVGISLETVVEAYEQLNENSLVKKNLAPMIQDLLKVSHILERLVTILRPVLQNDKTIAESIALLKDETFKKKAFTYCDRCNQEVKKFINCYPNVGTSFYESCEEIFNKESEQITFNTLNQWKSTLIAHQEGLKSKKFDVLSKKKEETKKIFSNDLSEIYFLFHEFDLKNEKDITGDDVRKFLDSNQKMFVWFAKRYKEFQTDYFEKNDYFYVLESLKKINHCLNKILEFPLMNFVSSQKILKYYKKTTLKKKEKKEIVSLVRELKILSRDFSSNIEKGLEINEFIKKDGKKEKIKKKKQKESIENVSSNWLFNKESGLDEKVCGSNKLVRDHIHKYKEISRKEVACHNFFTKVFISKTCEACGKVENFEKIQFLDFIKRHNFKGVDLAIVELKKLLPRIEDEDRKLKELIKSSLEVLKRDKEEDKWYENEHIYFDEPTFRAFIEKPNKINKSKFNFRESFSEFQQIGDYEFCKNKEYPFTSVDCLLSERLKKKLNQNWSSWLFEDFSRDSSDNTLSDLEYVNIDDNCYKR